MVYKSISKVLKNVTDSINMSQYRVTIPTISRSIINIDIDSTDSRDASYRAIEQARKAGIKLPNNAINWCKVINLGKEKS